MDVSVVIINYNTFRLTSSCIRSVLQHTRGLDFEIILVDNASSECDPLLFLREFPDIILVRNTENTGFARGNNTGIEKAKGEIILLLNSDTELTENSVLTCYNELKAQEKTAVITCRLVYPDRTVQRQCERFPLPGPAFLELSRLFKLLPKSVREEMLLGSFFPCDRPIHPDWVWGAFFMFRKKALDTIPGQKLSERFFMYCEDMEWCKIFRNAGWDIFFTPSTSVIHHVGSSGMGIQTTNKLRLIAENQKAFVLEYSGKGKWFWLRLFRLWNFRLMRRKKTQYEALFRIYKAL